jgi:ribonucleoside-diphosphate reductase alpha chain
MRTNSVLLEDYPYDKELYLTKIKDIKNGYTEVFDIEVENTHSYLINNVISHNTINLSSDIPKEKVAEVYLEAHKRGIIGVTVYRDGSREGILQHSDPKNNIIERDAPKRPKSLPCDVYKIKYNAKDWVVFVGLLNNKPYEVFAGQVDEVNISKHVTSGTIEKIGSNHYSFIYEGEVLIKNIIKTFDNTSHDDFARVLSLSLITGANIRHAIDQLKKSKGDITTFSKVIARALQKYLEGQHAGLCPECSSKLVYKNNCVECAGNCGWQSPCG